MTTICPYVFNYVDGGADRFARETFVGIEPPFLIPIDVKHFKTLSALYPCRVGTFILMIMQI